MAHPAATLLEAHGKVGETARELVRRRADLVEHARGSLEQHLVGVYAVLQRWRQPERVLLAGLLHSAYSTESFGYRLFGDRERPRVRELVGPVAERLVFAFCGCPREALLAAASAPAGAEEPAIIETRWSGVTVRLGHRDLAELLVIHAANLAEQVAGPSGRPALWLATASRILAVARPSLESVPAVLDASSRVVTQEEERALSGAYRALLNRRADRKGEGGGGVRSAETDDALSTSPVGEPLVLAGLLALASGRGAEAAALAERALTAFDTWGVAWDKRLHLSRWRDLAAHVAHDGRSRDDELDAAARRTKRLLDGARGSPERLWTQLDALAPRPVSARSPSRPPEAEDANGALHRSTPGSLPPRFAEYIGGLRTNAERTMLQFYPGLRAQPWHDPREFPIVADLERLAPEIAAEARSFDAARFQDEAEDIRREGRWGVLFLLEMGRRNDANLARCPATRWILDHHRTLTTHAGLMYFSSLDARTRVAAHQGPTNVRLRCHLGLDIPEGCGMRVGGVTSTWQEGRALVFDDSFLHEVWNDGDRRRLVLVLDLWHPDLSDDEVALLAGLHRYGAANEANAHRYWARNDAARARAAASPSPEPAPAAGPAPVTPRILDEKISAAMRAGDLALASEHAARYAELCRGTRWYPVRRDDDPPLPLSIPWEPVLTPSKLVHDVEQLQYLQARGILGAEAAAIAADYEAVLDTLRPLGLSARVPLLGVARAQVGHVYNRLVHVRSTPRVPRALSPQWDAVTVEDEYLGGRPSVVVVDHFLSDDAIESLRLFCLESTIWSTNRYDHGRLGSFFRDGFNCPLLVQIAEELRAALPRVIGTRHPVTQVWGFKYATTQPSLPAHADFAAVNVNFWITPDDANLDPDGGGLVLYDVEAPRDWDFATYNRNGTKIRELLAERKARPTHIPYRYNRAVIFDSDLFHTTPALRFRAGYENRRINVTVLFGDRQDHG